MPKVKVPRKNISLDMTAMCDVAFLLLTFFMLTTKFKPEEPVQVKMPSSISETTLPDDGKLQLAVGADGRIFMGVDGQPTRLKMLEEIGKKYNMTFTDAEKFEFAKMDAFGTPLNGLKQLLALSTTERNKVKQPGLPCCDSLNTELTDWVLYARATAPDQKLKVAIRSDVDTDYEVVKKLIATLQAQKINKFNLVTSPEAKPKPKAN